MVPQHRPMRDSRVASATVKSDLQMLHDLKFEYPKTLLCGYLNINNLRNKMHDLRLIIHDVHCEKSVQIRSYFWSVFSCIRTEYGVSLHIQRYKVSGDTKYLSIYVGKYVPEITLSLDIFHAVVPVDYFAISETKLDNSFPNVQLTINNYETRARRERDKHGGGLIEFVRKGLIYKRLRK